MEWLRKVQVASIILLFNKTTTIALHYQKPMLDTQTRLPVVALGFGCKIWYYTRVVVRTNIMEEEDPC